MWPFNKTKVNDEQLYNLELKFQQLLFKIKDLEKDLNKQSLKRVESYQDKEVQILQSLNSEWANENVRLKDQIADLLKTNEELKDTMNDQYELNKQLETSLHSQRHENFMDKAAHNLELQRRQFQTEEEKYKDFINMYGQVVEKNSIMIKETMDALINKLEQIQANPVIIQGTEIKRNTGYKQV